MKTYPRPGTIGLVAFLGALGLALWFLISLITGYKEPKL